ncbi:unnamed protein product [Lasius platythorax]|uniref:Uncharacterized protein n=1 Tax=Lasius platythorax TaxID=488582 RepID=A0AAV2NF81_9HYME
MLGRPVVGGFCAPRATKGNWLGSETSCLDGAVLNTVKEKKREAMQDGIRIKDDKEILENLRTRTCAEEER